MKFIFQRWALFVTLFLVTGLCSNKVGAAVDSVKYYLKYNSTGCYYEAHLLVVHGSATTTSDLLAGALQFTFVVPHTTPAITLTKVADINPYVQGSTTPVTWNMPSSRLNAPTNTPNVDYIGMTLAISSVSGTKVYPTLTPNTDIILTTFTLSQPVCGAGVRMWVNNGDDLNPDVYSASAADPSGAVSGMFGADFNNSFTVGSVTETYFGSGTSSVVPPSPVISSVVPSCTGTTFSLAATATPGSSCASPLTYSWTGPSSFTNTTAGFTISSPTTANSGTYRLTVTDAQKCTTTFAQGYNATTCSLLPLPIKLNNFDAIANKCEAILNWESPVGTDVLAYEIQYSQNGIDFVPVGKINEQSGNNGSFSYHYTQSSGKGYYRLRVIGLNGSSNYSQTITVMTSCEDHIISIAPNPTSNYIKVSGIVSGNEVRVMDMLGQIVTSTVANSNVATLDLSTYPSGVYAVVVIQGKSSVVAGQVVKK